MKVLILGSGVVGVAAAYYLNRAGHEVEVVDRQPAAGLETSFANGGQISASHAAPWASPEVPLLLLKWLGHNDAPLLFRLRADPSQWLWALRFLANCLPGRSQTNTAKNLALGIYSRAQMREIRADTGVQYDALTRGILQVYRHQPDLDVGSRHAEWLTKLGCTVKPLTREQCFEVEPALRDRGQDILGGTYAPDDETGDAQVFTHELARVSAERGVVFRYGTYIHGISAEGGRVTGVATDQGRLTADVYVVALGSYTEVMLKPLGVDPHIFPTKGYSVTVPTEGRNGAPTTSITDHDNRIVFSRLGDRMRVAGTAEFAGYDTHLNEARARVILDLARKQFPNAGNFERAQLWTGLRPLTPDCVCVLGATKYANLFLDTGHGTLGWTLAAGSGKALADLIGGKKPEIDLAPYSVTRF